MNLSTNSSCPFDWFVSSLDPSALYDFRKQVLRSIASRLGMTRLENGITECFPHSLRPVADTIHDALEREKGTG